MAKLTKSIEIEASPEKVFTFINDHEKMNKVNKGMTEGEYTSKGPVGVGTTMHFVARVGRQTGEFDMKITEFVKNKKVASRTIGASKVKMDQSWTFEPTAKGTKLTYSMDYELPYSILGKVLDKLKFGKDMEKTMEKAMENVKKALET
jgi:carbon monoxide dehydrogenase subunit G